MIASLRRPKATKPRALKTLSSAIATFFQKQVSDEEVAAVVAAMEKAGFLAIIDGKVSYGSGDL